MMATFPYTQNCSCIPDQTCDSGCYGKSLKPSVLGNTALSLEYTKGVVLHIAPAMNRENVRLHLRVVPLVGPGHVTPE